MGILFANINTFPNTVLAEQAGLSPTRCSACVAAAGDKVIHLVNERDCLQGSTLL